MQHMDSRDPFAGVLARMRHDVLTLTSGSSGRRSFHILGHIPSYFVLRYRGRPPPAPMPSLHFVSLPNHVVQESTESIVGRVSAAFVKCCPDLRSASDDRDTSSASGVASRGEHNNDGGGDDANDPAASNDVVGDPGVVCVDTATGDAGAHVEASTAITTASTQATSAGLRVVAVCGLGGIGKSTAAVAYVRAHCHRPQHHQQPAHPIKRRLLTDSGVGRGAGGGAGTGARTVKYPAGIVWLCGETFQALQSSIHQAVTRHIASESQVTGLQQDHAQELFFGWLTKGSSRWLVVIDNVDDASEVLPWFMDHLPAATTCGDVLLTSRCNEAAIHAELPDAQVVEMDCLKTREAIVAMARLVHNHNAAYNTRCGWDDSGAPTNDRSMVDASVPPELHRMHLHDKAQYDALVLLVSELLGGLPLAIVGAAGALCGRGDLYTTFLAACQRRMASFLIDEADKGAEALAQWRDKDRDQPLPDAVRRARMRQRLSAVWDLSREALSPAAQDLMRVLAHFPPDSTLEEVFVWGASGSVACDGVPTTLRRRLDCAHSLGEPHVCLDDIARAAGGGTGGERGAERGGDAGGGDDTDTKVDTVVGDGDRETLSAMPPHRGCSGEQCCVALRRRAVRLLVEELTRVSLVQRWSAPATEVIPGMYLPHPHCPTSNTEPATGGGANDMGSAHAADSGDGHGDADADNDAGGDSKDDSSRDMHGAASMDYACLSVHRVVQDVVRLECGTYNGDRQSPFASVAMFIAIAAGDGNGASSSGFGGRGAHQSRACPIPVPGFESRLWIAAHHASACARWASPRVFQSHLNAGTVEWCVAKPSKLAHVLACAARLGDSLVLEEWVLRAGEGTGLWKLGTQAVAGALVSGPPTGAGTSLWKLGTQAVAGALVSGPPTNALQGPGKDAVRPGGGETTVAVVQRTSNGAAMSRSQMCQAPPRPVSLHRAPSFREEWLTIAECGKAGHSGIATALQNLGAVYQLLGAPRVAITLFGMALSMREDIHGDTAHEDVARSWFDLACAQYNLGQFNDARESHQRALAIRLSLDPTAKGVKLAASRERLAWLQLQLGKLDEAASLSQDALAVLDGMHNSAHNHRAIQAMLCLAKVRHKQGNYEEAVEQYRVALKRAQRIHRGSDHHDVAEIQYSLAMLLCDMCDDAAAGMGAGRGSGRDREGSRALNADSTAAGDSEASEGGHDAGGHRGSDTGPQTASAAAANAGEVLREAEQLYTASLEACKRMYGGIEHRGVAMALAGLGDVCAKSGRQEEAVRRYDDALAVFRAAGVIWEDKNGHDVGRVEAARAELLSSAVHIK